jgi:hypothetical protein
MLGDKLFDERFLHADIEFYVRVLKDGADYGFVHQVLTFTRTHEEAVSVFAHVMGTGRVESLAMVVKHGPAFLTKKEQRALEQAHRREYTKFLFRVMLKAWDRGIWKYQVEKRQILGVRIGVLDILAAGLSETATGILSPLETARRIIGDYARARSRRSPEDGFRAMLEWDR